MRRFACTREQGGMTVEIPVNEVPAEILPREELSQVCTPMDVFSRIWYVVKSYSCTHNFSR